MVEQAGCARLDRHIPVSFVGAFVGAEIGSLIFGTILSRSLESGRVACGDGTSPALCVVGRQMLLMLLGSWIALRIVDRMR